MNILVTGGTGVIGGAVLPALLKEGHTVRLLSRHADRDAARYPEAVSPFAADLTRPEPLDAAVAGCPAIVHIAGIDEEHPPEITYENLNVGATGRLCDAAAAQPERPFFVYISSLGANTGQSEYHRSKFRAEERVRRYPGPWLILRPGNVYGPGDETISTLLKMVRALPAVPVVNRGDQRFQPLWHEDFGHVIAEAVRRTELAGRTLELAGPDVTTVNDVLDRLARITGRKPARMSVPAAIVAAGTRTAEALGTLTDKLASSAGLGMPINTAKLQMLLEGSVITNPHSNALQAEFPIRVTSLQEGLEKLADLLPEQSPGAGIGAVERSVYSAEILGSRYTPAELIDLVCEHLADLMPIEFTAEPGAPASAEPGRTLTGAIPGRGHIQVRMIDRADRSATFITVEGHPLAGVLTLAAEREAPRLRFAVEVVSQPANVFDWVALRTVGSIAQSRNWRTVVQRVAELSGGAAPAGVQVSRERLAEDELRGFNQRIQELLDAQKRSELEHSLSRNSQ